MWNSLSLPHCIFCIPSLLSQSIQVAQLRLHRQPVQDPPSWACWLRKWEIDSLWRADCDQNIIIMHRGKMINQVTVCFIPNIIRDTIKLKTRSLFCWSFWTEKNSFSNIKQYRDAFTPFGAFPVLCGVKAGGNQTNQTAVQTTLVCGVKTTNRLTAGLCNGRYVM